MKLLCFSIYDLKAQAYLAPFFLPNKPLALRAFGDCVNDNNHQFGKNPFDFTLFYLGEFDVEQGIITPVDREAVANGVELVKNREGKEF